MNPPSRPQSAEIAGLPARVAALKLLDAVLRRGESLDAVSANAVRGLPPADAAFAIAIAAETCRHLVDLDALIDGATAKPLASDIKARMVLRMALVQALVLKTPAHAAIATALALVTGGPKRLVHGVFGSVMRSGVALPDAPTLPTAVAERWRAAHGDAMVNAAGQALAHAPPLDLTINRTDETAVWAEKLGGTSLMPGHVRLPRGGDVARLPGFADGAWWVQDVAASLPARLLGAGHGRTALDMCAAPGGKTMQLAAAGWAVTALDASERRLERLAANLRRTNLSATLERGDGRALPPEAVYDAVLLDAPCSATGIFRRHPDVLHRIDAADIANRTAYQAIMLDAAAGAVREGGTLVYAVCSLEPDEGENQVRLFIERQPYWHIDTIRDEELPHGISPAAEGWVRIAPPMLADHGGADGFFMARLRMAANR